MNFQHDQMPTLKLRGRWDSRTTRVNDSQERIEALDPRDSVATSASIEESSAYLGLLYWQPLLLD